MKKILLASAALVAAMSASAANLVVNGDFEDPNFTQSVPGGYTWEPWNTQNYLDVLPGWSFSTGGEWNGGIEIKHGEDFYGDGDIRPEDDQAFAHFVGYNDNGWTNISLIQIVEGLTPGTEYTLDFLMAANFPEGASWTPDPNCGYNLAEVGKDAEGNAAAGFGIKKENIASTLSMDFETPTVVTFTAPADGKVWLEFYLANNYDKNNKHDNLWMDLDMVRLMTSAEYAGIEKIAAVEENAPVEYFNLQGVRVANPENGLYIRRQGKTCTKVVL